MRLFVNIFTAWVCVVLMAMLVIIWILRILVKKKIVKKGTFLFNMHRTLRIYHKEIGITFLIISLIHGLTSTAKLFSNNWGSICFWAIVAMSAIYIIRPKIPRKIWANIHRVITISVVVLLVIHLLDTGIVAPMLMKNAFIRKTDDEVVLMQIEQEYIEIDMESNTYRDGTYQGSANGYGPNLVVEVIIEDDKIIDVEILSHNEVGQRFYSVPMEYLPPAIIENQTPQVDSVSGATMTSVAIKNAVIIALGKAINNMEELPVLEALPQGRRRH